MENNYTLHKLPQGFIVTSDEQGKEGELGYIPFEGGNIKTVGKYFADDDEDHDEGGTLPGFIESYQQPKLTNGKIKILKLL